MQTRRRRKRQPCAGTVGWPEVSHQPPIPVQKTAAEEERENRHAAEEDTKGHLVMAINKLGRLPRAASCPRRRFLVALHAPTGALNPHEHDCSHPKKRSGKGGGKYRENREAHTQKRTHHSHELYVTEAHPLHAAPAQVDRSCSIDERSPDDSAEHGIQQREEAPLHVRTDRQ